MIFSIGEIVWDIFTDKEILGGAPLNVAYHLARLGREVTLVSRLGTDELAAPTLARIAELGLGTTHIQQDDELPTGRVMVSVNEQNEPRFDIVAPAAWDRIEPLSPSVLPNTPFHLVFGTLAQRAEKSRATIRSLWPLADITFYDVNLRPPFTTPDLVLDSLAAADVVKLNDQELHMAADWAGLAAGTLQERARSFFARYELLALAVTRGAKGSLLVCEEGLFEHPGFPVKVVDTVGAGDAFFAALIDGIINRDPWTDCLERANRRGSLVAGRSGATPEVDDAGGNRAPSADHGRTEEESR